MSVLRRIVWAASLLMFASACESHPASVESREVSPEATSASASASASASTASSTICATHRIPAGMVVTGLTLSRSCPGYGSYAAAAGHTNAVILRAPTSPLTVCSTWPIPTGFAEQRVPAGYAVVATTVSSTCTRLSSYAIVSGQTNAITIQAISSPMTVCGSWPVVTGYIHQSIPAGFVVVGTPSSPSCTGYDRSGRTANAVTIRTPVSNSSICTTWRVGTTIYQQTIPAGFVMVGAGSVPACGNYDPSGRSINSLLIATPTSPMTICASWTVGLTTFFQSVPAGYRLVGRTSSASCPGYQPTRNATNALSIRRL